jgi:hypothetical protein
MPPHNGDDDLNLTAGRRPAHVVGDPGVTIDAGTDEVGAVDGLVEGDREHLYGRPGADVHDGRRVVGRDGSCSQQPGMKAGAPLR